MNEDWSNAFGILMCREICDGAGAGICDGVPSTCSSFTSFVPELVKMYNSSKSAVDTGKIVGLHCCFDMIFLVPQQHETWPLFDCNVC